MEIWSALYAHLVPRFALIWDSFVFVWLASTVKLYINMWIVGYSLIMSGICTGLSQLCLCWTLDVSDMAIGRFRCVYPTFLPSLRVR